MNVSLTPELEKYVDSKVRSGMYHTASEVVREGLRLLKEREELHQQKLVDLRAAVQVGIDQADRGDVVPLTRELIEDVKRRGRERQADRKSGRKS
ncbi:type II toxin-antitoxin system ParD family antitoxin [Planctomyces sp. SH-PL62]|uniref:type II toxin-antitoxin system ParD family antitoxin n=1 Tax=Planctomyces sp. SH-PL62 TaxID=1636152 RepID=UPI00078C46A1|nr:type II toxin-antitoxin system ParD family antitoxin [Planctomyces sp. SH-PL62]AMV37647.1 Antitoxin ParD4 [Planctomyces sp. SH-PL62]